VPFGLVSLITAVLVGDMGASLAVTVNALRLARLKVHEAGRTEGVVDARHRPSLPNQSTPTGLTPSGNI
jgi:hypothetical protein